MNPSNYLSQSAAAMSVAVGRIINAREAVRAQMTREERIADELSDGVVSDDKTWKALRDEPWNWVAASSDESGGWRVEVEE